MSSTLVIRNARIWTGRRRRPWARTLTIDRGRVAALDDDDGARVPAARVLDAGGRTVVPGLIDSHLHLLLGARMLAALDLGGVGSRAAFEQAVARQHAALAPGEWLVGHGWSEENWPGHAMPDKTWLAAAAGRPAACYRMDQHAVVVNDAALARGGLTAPDLARRRESLGETGRIGVDPATGAPTGLFVEAAAWQLINPLVPAPPDAVLRQAVLAAQRHAHEVGLTAVGTMEYRRDLEAVLWPLRSSLSLCCRVILLDREDPIDFDLPSAWRKDARIAVIGFKTFLDGTLGVRTARLLAPYLDDPGNTGVWLERAASGSLETWARAVVAAGFSPSMHAIGDAAVRRALDALEAIGDGDGGEGVPPAPRIEHAQQIHPDDLPRFSGVTASMQPLHKAVDGRYALARLGPRRVAGAYPFRDLLQAGAALAFGSDWPVVSCDPLAGMRAAVTGRTVDEAVFLPEQCLSVEEALAAYTTGAAASVGLPDAGVLAPGSRGDAVLLDRDPFTADWVGAPPRVAMTIAGGEVVHVLPDFR